MKKVIFATNNSHKLEEVQEILDGIVEVLSLKDVCCYEDIPETAETLEGNSLLKARYIWDKYRIDCFADDTGLEVKALNNAPGVYSARYAGEGKSPEDNINKVLQELNGKEDRSARFRTVIALILEGKEFLFEGEVNGQLIKEKRGMEGFGYDPLFIPDGYDKTFAELGNSIKNSISHRAQAVNKLKLFFNEKA